MEERLELAASRPAAAIPAPSESVSSETNESELADVPETVVPLALPGIEPAELLVTPELVSSESTNVWPDEAAEAAFLSEGRGGAEATAAPKPTSPTGEDDDEKALPQLDDLVNRIPADTRELLDELFRAKFTKVRRVKQADLKA